MCNVSSPVISNLSQFQLSPFGAQASGRQILADEQMQKLLHNFQASSQEQSSTGYHALAVISAVNSLRSSAVPVNSYVRNGSPSTRCISGPGFEIEYELNMGLSQTDITITDIRVVRQNVHEITKPALWEVNSKSRERGWRVSEQPIYDLAIPATTTGSIERPVRVGINGYCDNIEHAASILPMHIARGSDSEKDKLRQTGYQLFYTPQSGTVKAGWQFVKQLGKKTSSADDKEAGRILASYMQDAHQRSLYVEWTSHRGGSAILTEAMRCLKQGNINLEGKQRIFLSDHTSSHYEADIARRAIGMDVRDTQWFNSAPGLPQLLGGQKLGAATIACSLNKLIHHTPKDQLAGEAVSTAYDMVVQSKNTMALGATIAAFGSSPALILALLGTALASTPALTNAYHSNPVDPLKQLVNKLQNKVL